MLPLLEQLWESWKRLERASKLMGAISIVVVIGVIYACSVVADHIEEAMTQKAAANTAMYMDSLVEPLVQDLAQGAVLSAASQQALERALPAGATNKPIVQLSIWAGDRMVYHSEGNAPGLRLPSASCRERALRGQVVARLALDRDGDGQGAGHTPILEILAPVRQTGTNRIIALAATSELAVELTRMTRAAQYASYVVIASGTLSLLLVLFGVMRGLQRRIGELARQHAADEHFLQRALHPNAQVFELNQRHLRRLDSKLHAGPLQLAALALLKVDSLSELPGGTGHLASERLNDISAIRKAIEECRNQIRDLSASLSEAQEPAQRRADEGDDRRSSTVGTMLGYR